jgi:hypothetical protein
MKKIIFLSLIFFQIQAYAGLELLEINQVNCKKINDFGPYDKEGIAREFKAPMSSIAFVGTDWGTGKYGGMQCNLVYDTPKGPKRCKSFMILTEDKGKSAFGMAVSDKGMHPVCF